MSNTENTNIARFVLGATEVKVADAWRKAGLAEHKAGLAFYKAVILAHEVNLVHLKPQPKGVPRSNVAQAAFDFTRAAYAVAKVGATVAQQLFDKNTSGDTLLHPEGRKPQAKRALTQSLFGAKDWGLFVKRMEAFEAEVTGAQPEGKGASERKSDADFVADRVTAAINRLARDAENMDGSIDIASAAKLAATLKDLLVAYGLKRK